MTESRDSLTEAEATRLWQKAAQLQAEAARLAEVRAAGEAQGSVGPDDADRASDGYALVHVKAAALEAGIGEEFVEAALAEVRADRALEERSGTSKYGLSRFLMGNNPATVAARRVIQAEPREVLASMEAIFPNEPYTLLLKDRTGDPLRGGTLVFDIQGVGFSTAGQAGFKGDASYADLRQVFATLVPLPGGPARTEVTLRSPILWAIRINAGISSAVSLLGGAFGLGVSVGIAAALGLAAPVVPIVVAAGGGLAGTLSMGGMRSLYRYGMGRGEKSLETLLGAVAANAEGGWGIAPPEE